MKNGVAVLDTPADLPDGTPVRIEVENGNGNCSQEGSPQEHAQGSVVDLAGDWPAEDSIDEFLEFIREVRR